MKLLYCKKCNSLFNLERKHRECECGACGGKYTGLRNAIYYGPESTTERIGIDNNYLRVIFAKKFPKELYHKIALLKSERIFKIDRNDFFQKVTKKKYYES